MTRHPLLARSSIAAIFGLLSACTVGPDYQPPSTAALQVPARFVAERDAVIPTETDLARWWTSFDDPVLSQLVERALAANLDIAEAGARLRQARATLRGAQGQLLPTIGASGSVTRTIGQNGRTVIDPTTGQTLSSGGDTTVFRAGFDAAWEADIFGGIRRSVEAARADSESSADTLRFTQLTVASEAGLTYVDARLAQEQLRIAQANLAAQDETLEIVGFRVQAGLANALDLEQARQLRANTAASIPALQQSYRAAVNAIAVLLGQVPGSVDALMQTPQPVPLPPRAIGAGIPADIIQRRPDVAQAERTLAAETARIGVATADLYPALRLSGSFSGSDTSLSNLPSSMIGSLVAAVTAPIFEGGQIRARIEGQRASTDAALAAYRRSVLTALQDVENSLTALTSAEQREREAITAAAAAASAADLARLQYRSGLIDFQSLLDSERTLLSSQDNRAQARGARATATVQLYKALGGGWQAAPEPATVAGGGR